MPNSGREPLRIKRVKHSHCNIKLFDFMLEFVDRYTLPLDLLQLFFGFKHLALPHKQQEISGRWLKHRRSLQQLAAVAAVWANTYMNILNIVIRENVLNEQYCSIIVTVLLYFLCPGCEGNQTSSQS